MQVTRFSDAAPVRAAVRVEDGRLWATPFDAAGVPTESSLDVGAVSGADLAAVFDHVRFVFSVTEIAG